MLRTRWWECDQQFLTFLRPPAFNSVRSDRRGIHFEQARHDASAMRHSTASQLDDCPRTVSRQSSKLLRGVDQSPSGPDVTSRSAVSTPSHSTTLRDVRVTHQVVLDAASRKPNGCTDPSRSIGSRSQFVKSTAVPIVRSACGGLGCDPTGAEPGLGTPGDEQGERYSCAGDGLVRALPLQGCNIPDAPGMIATTGGPRRDAGNA